MVGDCPQRKGPRRPRLIHNAAQPHTLQGPSFTGWGFFLPPRPSRARFQRFPTPQAQGRGALSTTPQPQSSPTTPSRCPLFVQVLTFAPAFDALGLVFGCQNGFSAQFSSFSRPREGRGAPPNGSLELFTQKFPLASLGGLSRARFARSNLASLGGIAQQAGLSIGAATIQIDYWEAPFNRGGGRGVHPIGGVWT